MVCNFEVRVIPHEIMYSSQIPSTNFRFSRLQFPTVSSSNLKHSTRNFRDQISKYDIITGAWKS
ncbi:hypothetical protein C5167_049891 [Papaver somniferum]|uniref:Uncharacterized protein n=1 Tax=Papaver somniferum TaxID=3469 RepID=A0A4Y7KR17_PAPSO|nr:hypothetical protein C5167_049891 [Papaver somniferum]